LKKPKTVVEELTEDQLDMEEIWFVSNLLIAGDLWFPFSPTSIYYYDSQIFNVFFTQNID
jgi:hypothetical protein